LSECITKAGHLLSAQNSWRHANETIFDKLLTKKGRKKIAKEFHKKLIEKY
jgi:hypothetical protein